MDAKRVLIITYSFPPRPSVASLRLKGLAKYLPEFGWEPVILTANLPGEPDKCFRITQTPYPGDVSALLKKRFKLQPEKGLQEQVGIPLSMRGSKRSISGRLVQFIKGFIVYPDEQKLWLPFAIKAGRELLQKERYNALISSSGPVTTHMIASALRREMKIPWIADFRDLWTQNHCYPYTKLRKVFEKRLELKTLRDADALVSVSEPLADKLASLHKGKQVFAVPNGFDPDDIGSAPLTKKFTITYTGQLYHGKRDPELLLRGIYEMIKEGEMEENNIGIRFYGPFEYWLDQEIKRYHLEGVVKQNGIVSREIALEKQRESQLLLLLNWDDPDEKGVYTGKIFEYLAARRPILAIGGPEGVVSQLLRETGAGVHIKNMDDLKQFLRSCYKEYQATGQVVYCGIEERVAKYSHRDMARKFAEILNNLLARAK